PRLFAWLLREGRFDFITHAEEDAAIARLKRFDYGQTDDPRRSERETAARLRTRQPHVFRQSLGPDERFAEACIVTGRKAKLDPFRIAQAQGWTRERWEDARMAYELADQQRWHADQITPHGFTHILDDTEGG
ncbi:MAG: hypothetical protein AAGL98_00460, partial [Planctomycetota bacterium]